MSTTILVLLGIGLAGGMLTTVAGLGGGMMMVLVLSLVWDPQRALAVTAPALLVGNVHRAWMYRQHGAGRLTWLIAGAAAPGAFVGGLLMGTLPEGGLRLLLLAVTALSAAVEIGWVRWRLPRSVVVPAAFASGLLTAASGGGAVLLAAVLLACGLRERAYVMTASVACVTVHLSRIAAYGLSGAMRADVWALAGVLAAAILLGNRGGDRLRGQLATSTQHRLSWAVLLGCLTLAVAGL
jgi:hypothetical protein